MSTCTLAWAGRTPAPWRAAPLTPGILLVLGFIAGKLAGKYHILGTDKVGEDVFYQGLKGVRTGLVIGTLTTLVMLPAAVLLGIMAGYFRGLADDIPDLRRIKLDPDDFGIMLLIAAAILMLQVHMSNHEGDFANLVERADLRLLFLCLILGVTSWAGLCWGPVRGRGARRLRPATAGCRVNFTTGSHAPACRMAKWDVPVSGAETPVIPRALRANISRTTE